MPQPNPSEPSNSLSPGTRTESLSFAGQLRRLFASRPMLAAEQIEHRLYGLMARSTLSLTRVALGIFFLWFGILKFLLTVTPVDKLAEQTGNHYLPPVPSRALPPCAGVFRMHHRDRPAHGAFHPSDDRSSASPFARNFSPVGTAPSSDLDSLSDLPSIRRAVHH